MMRARSVVVACMAMMSFGARPVQAQEPDTAPVSVWRFGVTVAAGVQPDAVLPICSRSERTTSSGIGAFGVSAGRPVGGLHLEGRVSGSVRAEINCVGGPPLYDGVITRSWQTAPGGSHLFTSEARLRLDTGPGDAFTTALGAGWAWGKNTPFVGWSVGTRGGGRVRWGIEVEVRSYFAPWRRRTESYFQDQLLEVIEDEGFRRAGVGFTLGVAVETPTRP